MAENRQQKAKPIIRTLPHSEEAEKALLGALMLKTEAIHDVADYLKEEAFYEERHRRIYRAMTELIKKGRPIDPLTVVESLENQGNLEQVGGQSYIAELSNSVPSSAHAVHYASIVFKKYMLRQLVEASEYLLNLGYEESGEIEELLDMAQKKVYDLSNYSLSDTVAEIKDELAEAFERFEKLHNSKDALRGVPTGFSELDGMISGFQESDLIILAARPSVGKTAFALDIARQTAVNHGTKVAIFSLEMSSQQLVDRMIAAQASVDAWKLRTGQLTQQEDFDAIRQSLDKLSTAPIIIDDQPGNNVMKMRSVCRKIQREKGLDMIVVDYLQLMTPLGNYRGDSTVQQVTELSRSLKNLARDMKVPVLALSQLSRAVEQRGGKPRLSDLRDSGSIEQDADLVMFIHREDKYREQSERTNIAEILIEKHRNGATGKIELFFNDKKATFQSINKSSFGGAEQEFDDF